MRMLIRDQSGATLIIGLIMLLLITVIMMASHKMTLTSQVIVQNLQSKNVVLELANSTLEDAISTTRVVNAPSAVFLVGCDGVANARCYDINADGVLDVSVALTPDPFCVQSNIIQNSQLDFDDAQDAGCIVGGRTESGIQGAVNNNSLCAASLWEVNAVGTDSITSAQQTVSGAYSVRVPTDSVETSCP